MACSAWTAHSPHPRSSDPCINDLFHGSENSGQASTGVRPHSRTCVCVCEPSLPCSFWFSSCAGTWMDGFSRCPRLLVVCLGSWPSIRVWEFMSLKASITTCAGPRRPRFTCRLVSHHARTKPPTSASPAATSSEARACCGPVQAWTGYT